MKLTAIPLTVALMILSIEVEKYAYGESLVKNYTQSHTRTVWSEHTAALDSNEGRTIH